MGEREGESEAHGMGQGATSLKVEGVGALFEAVSGDWVVGRVVTRLCACRGGGIELNSNTFLGNRNVHHVLRLSSCFGLHSVTTIRVIGVNVLM